MRAAEQDRPDVARRRKHWRRRQGGFDPQNLVFLDETSAKTNLTRLRARAPRGQRVHASAPAGCWHTTTIIGSLRLDGTCACMSIEGSTDTAAFNGYVRHVLLNTLRTGDVVVMDNLSSHKSPETLRLIESAGASVLFLPPYSPDLNPIEKMWGKLKQLLRSAEARTRAKLDEAIGAAIRLMTASNALGWFASCGYSII